MAKDTKSTVKVTLIKSLIGRTASQKGISVRSWS